MQLSRNELTALAERHQKKADSAYQAYQETGIRKYCREYEKNSDYADAFWMAADAVEDRVTLGFLKAELSSLAAAADKCLDNSADSDDMKALAEKLIASAVAYGLYARQERIHTCQKGVNEDGVSEEVS